MNGHTGTVLFIDGQDFGRLSMMYDGQGLPSQFVPTIPDVIDEVHHKVYVLPVFGDSSNGGSITGLLLKADGTQRGTYERVGSFQFAGNWAFHTDDFEAAAKEGDHKLTSEEYVDVVQNASGKANYIIDLT
jgi:hypothetical protein